MPGDDDELPAIGYRVPRFNDRDALPRACNVVPAD